MYTNTSGPSLRLRTSNASVSIFRDNPVRTLRQCGLQTLSYGSDWNVTRTRRKGPPRVRAPTATLVPRWGVTHGPGLLPVAHKVTASARGPGPGVFLGVREPRLVVLVGQPGVVRDEGQSRVEVRVGSRSRRTFHS